MAGYIIMKNSCCFFSDFYLNSEVPLFSDARAIRRVDSYEVGAPLLDEASNTELPHSVWTASFSDNGFAYLPNQFVLLQPYQCAFFSPDTEFIVRSTGFDYVPFLVLTTFL